MVLFFEIFGILFSVILVYLGIRYLSKEKALLDKEKKRVELLAGSFSGLTSITGSFSALNHIAESLTNFGFEKVLILTANKEKLALTGDIGIGFGEEFSPSEIEIPLDKEKQGILTQVFFDQAFQVFDEKKKPKIENISVKSKLLESSFMIAPISRKKDVSCWESTKCSKAECPSYEAKDTRCWLTPKTDCISHLKGNYDESIFEAPNKKIKACLDCNIFHCLGIVLVAKNKNYRFSEEEKTLFHTFAYQAGAVLEKGYLLTDLELREKELSRRMYELSILKELGDRIGYSLNVEKIVDIITSSLVKLLDYSVVAYMLLRPDKVYFKCQLEEPLNRKFIDDIRGRMLASLAALMNQEFKDSDIEEELSGTVIDNTMNDPIRSFFNIPIVIAEKTVGLLTIASSKPGLYKENEVNILYKITSQASNAVSRLESVLEAEKGKLNDMVVSMIDGVIMVDNDNRIIAVNPAAKKMLGITEEEPTIFDIINSLQGKLDIRSKIEESLKLHRTIVIDELKIENLILKVFISPVKPKISLKESKENLLGVVVLMHDVTKEKEVEKMKSEFVSVASHQLRTPLSAIKWFLEMLINGDAGEANMEQISYLTQAHETNEHMIDLVNSLLNISRIESGRIAVELEKLDIIELCEGIFDEIKMIAEGKKQKIEIVKPKEKITAITTDSRLFRQVIQNLLSNAVKYTPEGGSVKFTISKKDDGYLQFDVKDNGLGIPRHQQDKLFQKFFRADNVVEMEAEGTGLGLYVAKSLIETLGGKIWFESEENKGTTFSCTLPLSGSKPKKGEKTLISTDISKEFSKYHAVSKS